MTWMLPNPKKAKMKEKLNVTLRKDVIDFQMNFLNLISQEEKICQMEILMNMKKKSECHP